MKKLIEIGDFVSVIDDVYEGVVIAISHDTFTIDIDGFLYDYDRSDLVKIEKHIDNEHINVPKDFKTQKFNKGKSKKSIKTKTITIPNHIIDLHIHHLTTSEKGMTKHDKLLLQLRTAKNKIDDAIKNKYSKLIFIHGIGKGVLKNELIKLFEGYSNIEYYDASYMEYGYGATEIKIYNN